MIKNRSRKKESCRHCIQWNRSHHFNYCCHHLRFGNLFDHFKRSFSKTTTNKQSVLVSCGLDRLTYKFKQHTGQKTKLYQLVRLQITSAKKENGNPTIIKPFNTSRSDRHILYIYIHQIIRLP